MLTTQLTWTGAEDADASKTAVDAKLHVIDDGTCVLVQLNVSDDE